MNRGRRLAYGHHNYRKKVRLLQCMNLLPIAIEPRLSGSDEWLRLGTAHRIVGAPPHPLSRLPLPGRTTYMIAWDRFSLVASSWAGPDHVSRSSSVSHPSVAHPSPSPIPPLQGQVTSRFSRQGFSVGCRADRIDRVIDPIEQFLIQASKRNVVLIHSVTMMRRKYGWAGI